MAKIDSSKVPYEEMLRQLQQDRKAALQQVLEEAELLAQLAASKGESYDIERDFPSEALPRQFVCSRRQIARLVAHRRRLATATVIALLAVDAGYAIYLQVHGTQHGLDTSVGHGIPVY